MAIPPSRGQSLLCHTVPVQVWDCRVDNVNFLLFLFPLPGSQNRLEGVKALCKGVIIHREMNSRETCKVLASKNGALNKITMCFL